MDQVHSIQLCYLCESTQASALAITIATMLSTGTFTYIIEQPITTQTALSVHSACERNSNDKVLWALTCIVLGHIEIDHTKAIIIIHIRTISKYS